MSDEDDDYMSDKFLVGSDERPGLIRNRAKKRQAEIDAQQTALIKQQREERKDRTGANRNEKLQESLNRPIEAENKGYQLLAKMGYKAGQALGKDSGTTEANQSKGLVKPIELSIKMGRGGLGREQALRDLAQRRDQLRKERLLKAAGGERVTVEQFRERSMRKADERFYKRALIDCQQSCKGLDIGSGVNEPEILWFWPMYVEEEEESAEPSDDEPPEVAIDEYSDMEKLEMLTTYLRTSYQFCFWCGIRYSNVDDLDKTCPGLTRDDH